MVVAYPENTGFCYKDVLGEAKEVVTQEEAESLLFMRAAMAA